MVLLTQIKGAILFTTIILQNATTFWKRKSLWISEAFFYNLMVFNSATLRAVFLIFPTKVYFWIKQYDGHHNHNP